MTKSSFSNQTLLDDRFSEHRSEITLSLFALMRDTTGMYVLKHNKNITGN